MDRDRARHERKITSLLQDEARWLQKATFALNKAQDAREKLADVRDEEFEPLSVYEGDETVTIDTVKEAVASRVEWLLETIQKRRQRVLR
jgi:hypothetical protein